MKNITVMDFLTIPQMAKAMDLKKAKLIYEEIIKPNIKEINKKLGQENDPMYLAYVVEYAVMATHDWRS